MIWVIAARLILGVGFFLLFHKIVAEGWLNFIYLQPLKSDASVAQLDRATAF